MKTQIVETTYYPAHLSSARSEALGEEREITLGDMVPVMEGHRRASRREPVRLHDGSMLFVDFEDEKVVVLSVREVAG